MAVNKRYMVVGKWYGQRWAGADFEVWNSRADAEQALRWRDNGGTDSQRTLGELEYGSDFLHITRLEHTAFYADSDNDARYIDVYGFEAEYNKDTMSWVFLVGDPVYRLVLGPRGGVRKESF